MTEFCPSLWSEHETPEDQKNCSKCGLYKHGTRMVWGEGNPHAPIMVLLDNPGSREDRDDKPFICGTRQTLQQAIHQVGLTENDIYVTYILKRKPTKVYEKEQTREICMFHLKEQVLLTKPRHIVCLGNIAVQSFLGNPELDVKALRGKIHEGHGYPVSAAYHPLAARRRPNLWPLFVDDWKLVKAQLQ